MHKHKKSYLSLTLLATLSILLLSLGQSNTSTAAGSQWLSSPVGSAPPLRASSVHLRKQGSSHIVRVAERLQRRIRKVSFVAPSIQTLTEALRERRALFAQTVTFSLRLGTGEVLGQWVVSAHRYPTWVSLVVSGGSAHFALDREQVEKHLRMHGIEELTRPVNVTLEEVAEDDRGVLRAVTSGIATSGIIFDARSAADTVHLAFQEDIHEGQLLISRVPGAILNESGQELGELKLLAEGHSNFKGSSMGRIANVRKGLKERVNNVVVAPGSTFSFNDTLGAVTSRAGWHEALGIFNGDELRPVTGGGICQVATTVFRAIINAGFPIVARKEHSLYVSYYESHGIGLDATVYPGQQDLKFVNDTGNYLLVQSGFDGFEAFVNIYGTSDRRSVALEGPYFAPNAPEDLLVNGRKLRGNEIAWFRTVTHGDGREERQTIVSRYKTIPKTIVTKYVEQQKNIDHTAAPDVVSMRVR